MTRPVAPRPFGRDVIATKTFDEIVARVRRMAAHALTCERCKNVDHWAKRA